MIFTVDIAFGELPVGQRTMAGQEGDPCMHKEPTSWIKEFVGPLGCVKVDYTVDRDCGKWSEQWRDEKGMKKNNNKCPMENKSHI